MRQVFGLLVCAVACGGGDSPSAPTTRTIEILNYLVVPAVISIDGASRGSVPAGSGTQPSVTDLVVSSSSQSIRYVPNVFLYGDGSSVPSDLTGGTLNLPSGDVTLGIDNMVGAQPYISFRVVNTSGATIQVGLVSAGQVRCLGSLGNIASQSYGYYAFTATTEVRAYAAGSNCTGASRVWSNTTLSGYQINSGNITLSAVP